MNEEALKHLKAAQRALKKAVACIDNSPAMQFKQQSDTRFADWLIKNWNEIDGVIMCRGFTSKLQQAFNARTREPYEWKIMAAEAIAKLPTLPSGFFGQNERGWRPNMEWFLRPMSVQNIVEGKYDNWQPINKKNGYDDCGIGLEARE